ncbi:unnamed protein product [Zymoseptoria tritici ST99CH_3D7]|uniref:RING-type domain-containing protein n=1 Tax=Zymoseptoria tritici (strain ST99CH_3D7) TaxID=1276538 RepID=A0A1X7RYJ9_ZYMT9|nr:unnamed protein product [Zymoseptoria tritici ST99CH_3D7]
MAFPSRAAFLAEGLTPAPTLEGSVDVPNDEPGSGTGCPIHCDAFKKPVMTVCNEVHLHFFCRKCITKWLATHNDCPNCRFVFFPPGEADAEEEEEEEEEEDEDEDDVDDYGEGEDNDEEEQEDDDGGAEDDYVDNHLLLLPPRRRQVALILNRSMANIRPGQILPSSPRVLFITPPGASRNVYIGALLTSRLCDGLRFYMRPHYHQSVRARMYELWDFIGREFRDWLSTHHFQTVKLWWMREQLDSLLRRLPEHRFPSVGVLEWIQFRRDSRGLIRMLGDCAEDLWEVDEVRRAMHAIIVGEDLEEYESEDVAEMDV